MKRKLEDIRLELFCWLSDAPNYEAQDQNAILDEYEEAIKTTYKIKYKYFGLVQIPEDLYHSAKRIVPKNILTEFIKKLNYYLSTEQDNKKFITMRNNVINEIQMLTEQYSDIENT